MERKNTEYVLMNHMRQTHKNLLFIMWRKIKRQFRPGVSYRHWFGRYFTGLCTEMEVQVLNPVASCITCPAAYRYGDVICAELGVTGGD